MPMLDRITADPAILGGKACMRGMRIVVSLVVNLVANGLSADETCCIPNSRQLSTPKGKKIMRDTIENYVKEYPKRQQVEMMKK